MISHALQMFVLCITYIEHMLGFISLLYFILTTSYIFLILYQSLSYIYSNNKGFFKNILFFSHNHQIYSCRYILKFTKENLVFFFPFSFFLQFSFIFFSFIGLDKEYDVISHMMVTNVTNVTYYYMSQLQSHGHMI